MFLETSSESSLEFFLPVPHHTLQRVLEGKKQKADERESERILVFKAGRREIKVRNCLLLASPTGFEPVLPG